MTDLSVSNTFVSGTTAVAADVNENFSDIEDFINTTGVPVIQDGVVDEDAIASALAAQLGVNDGANVRRGKSIIAAESSALTSTSYGDLSNGPDTVTVVLPTDGIIRVAFAALWRGTHASGSTILGRAAIFVGSNQVKAGGATAAPSAVEAILSATGSTTSSGDGLVVTGGRGLAGTYFADSSAATDSSFVTTGQLVSGTEGAATINNGGGFVDIFAAAGTYAVGVKFKANTGCSLYVKERKLWVEVVGF